MSRDVDVVVPGHGLRPGDGPIRFTSAVGEVPEGITAGADYYVIKVSSWKIKLRRKRMMRMSSKTLVAAFFGFALAACVFSAMMVEAWPLYAGVAFFVGGIVVVVGDLLLEDPRDDDD